MRSMRSVAWLSATDKEGTSAVAFKIIIHVFFLIFRKLEEKFAAGIFPYSAVIFGGYGSYAFFFHAVVQQNEIACMGNAKCDLRTVRIIFPVHAGNRLELYLMFIEQGRNIWGGYARLSGNFGYM